MANLFENKYRLTVIIILSLILITLGVFIVVGVINNEEDVIDTAIVLTDGDLAINYIDGDNVSINDKKEHIYNVSITNTSLNKMYYSLNLIDFVETENMIVKVYNENDEVIFDTDDIVSNNEILKLNRLDAGVTARYKVVFKQSKKNKFKCVLKVINESLVTQTFADLILLNNDISLAKTNVGEQPATLKEGLIGSEDNYGTTYYFRGNISNNYVKIDDDMYRVVRINGNGTVRLVLDDVISYKFTYNRNSFDTAYKYASLSNSSLKDDLNHWINERYSEYMSSFAQDSFCTDLTFDNHSNGVYYSNTHTRIFYNEPTLKCSGEIYNGLVGMLSIDEIMFAGATRGESNKSFYLYNKTIEDSYLTNSAFYINADNHVYMMTVLSSGKMSAGASVTDEVFIRPVINLSTAAKIKGNGTLDDPYILVA